MITWDAAAELFTLRVAERGEQRVLGVLERRVVGAGRDATRSPQPGTTTPARKYATRAHADPCALRLAVLPAPR
jgi:hypothetical protein